MTLVKRRVLVTRPVEQSAYLMERLNGEGAFPIYFPLLCIQPDHDALALLPAAASNADWLIFVSPTAIDIAWPTLATVLLTARFACVGSSSARHLSVLAARDVLAPLEGSDSESLLAEPALQNVAGQNILIIRGHGGRPTLAHTLAQRGAQINFAEIYYRSSVQPEWQHIDQSQPDAIILTSSDMVERLFHLAGPSRTRTLQCLLYCVPHPRIAKRLIAMGATRIVTTRADDESLVAGLREWFSYHS